MTRRLGPALGLATLLLLVPAAASAGPPAAPAVGLTTTSVPALASAPAAPRRVVLEPGRGGLAGQGMGRWRRSIDILRVTYETFWRDGLRMFRAEYRMRDVTAFRYSGHRQTMTLDFAMRPDLPGGHFVTVTVGNGGSFRAGVQRDGGSFVPVTPRRHRVTVLPGRDLIRTELSTEHFRSAREFRVTSNSETLAQRRRANEFVDEERMSR